MTQIFDIHDRSSYYATNELLQELHSKMKENDTLINFAYTDYGGDFFYKVCIAFFSEKYPKNIVKENTSWSGENAFLFGEVAKAFLEQTENYLLGFEDIESYFYQMENEVRQESIAYFIKSVDTDRYIVSEQIPDAFMEWVEGYCRVLTSGLDYCGSDMEEKAIETGMLTPIN